MTKHEQRAIANAETLRKAFPNARVDHWLSRTAPDPEDRIWSAQARWGGVIITRASDRNVFRAHLREYSSLVHGTATTPVAAVERLKRRLLYMHEQMLGDIDQVLGRASMTSTTGDDRWFLLYGGSSPDGRGAGRYIGRTTDVKVALKHWREIKKDPYSTGCVDIITNTNIVRACYEEDFR